MIVEKDEDREQFGALKGATVAMDFAADAKGHLMDILAKGLYSRPKEAVLREYSTNALDAQIEIGETRPIEITLPTPLNPILKIRDFGVGLDMEGIQTVYSQYGASTKRQSNDFNGTLGLGGKSAFAYSNRFMVVSIRNGLRIEVAVTRNEDGTAEMVILDQRPTSDHRGTEVLIPAKSGDDFQHEAEKLYKWFPAGSVKVNGAVMSSWLERYSKAQNTLQIADGMYVINHAAARHYGEKDDVIVMGNIAYPAKLDTSLNRRSHHLVCFVPNGSVRFTPSRETLAENSVTRAKLAELAATFKTALITTMQAHIDAAKTRNEAVAVVANWKDIVPANIVPPGGYIYKGEPIPQNHSVGPTDPFLRVLSARKSGYHKSHDKERTLGLHYFTKHLWVDGFTPNDVTTSHAQKARQYLAENELSDFAGIVLAPSIPDEIKPWVAKVIDYDDLKAVKLPRTYVPGSSGRIPGSYDLHTSDQAKLKPYIAQYYAQSQNPPAYCTLEGVAAEEFRHWPTASSALFYATGNRYDTSQLRGALHAVMDGKPYTLVVMASTRVDKFKRNFPNAKGAYEAVKAGFKAWEATRGADIMLGLAIQQDWSLRDLRRLKDLASQIHDPELRKYVELSAKDLTSVKQTATMFRAVLAASVTHPTLINMDKRYPLLSESYPKHSVFYVNAVYDARQAGQTI